MTRNPFPILIVEDSKDDFFLLNHALRKNGIEHPVYWVKDGVEAIEYMCGQGIYADRNAYPIPKILIVDLKSRGLAAWNYWSGSKIRMSFRCSLSW
jgi:CheY-like chemotaxis protein